MDLESAFKLVNGIVLIPWILMWVAPRWNITQGILNFGLFSLLMAVLYLVCLILYLGEGGGSMGSIADLSTSFQHPGIVLLAWIHYLSFDLFVGAWILRDSQRCGMHHLIVLPCLIFSLMLGPVGLLLYWLLKGILKKEWILIN